MKSKVMFSLYFLLLSFAGSGCVTSSRLLDYATKPKKTVYQCYKIQRIMMSDENFVITGLYRAGNQSGPVILKSVQVRANSILGYSNHSYATFSDQDASHIEGREMPLYDKKLHLKQGSTLSECVEAANLPYMMPYFLNVTWTGVNGREFMNNELILICVNAHRGKTTCYNIYIPPLYTQRHRYWRWPCLVALPATMAFDTVTFPFIGLPLWAYARSMSGWKG